MDAASPPPPEEESRPSRPRRREPATRLRLRDLRPRIFVDAVGGFLDDHMNDWAAALTFYAGISLLPALVIVARGARAARRLDPRRDARATSTTRTRARCAIWRPRRARPGPDERGQRRGRGPGRDRRRALERLELRRRLPAGLRRRPRAHRALPGLEAAAAADGAARPGSWWRSPARRLFVVITGPVARDIASSVGLEDGVRDHLGPGQVAADRALRADDLRRPLLGGARRAASAAFS